MKDKEKERRVRDREVLRRGKGEEGEGRNMGEGVKRRGAFIKNKREEERKRGEDGREGERKTQAKK